MLVVVVVVVVTCHGAHAWGPEGHRLTAYVASKLVSPSVLEAATGVLQASESFVAVATWADTIKSDPDFDWAYNLHFVNQDKSWECSISLPTDCADGVCVPYAIANYTSILRAGVRGRSAVSRDDGGPLDQAMKFLIHFSGDIHQVCIMFETIVILFHIDAVVPFPT